MGAGGEGGGRGRIGGNDLERSFAVRVGGGGFRGVESVGAGLALALLELGFGCCLLEWSAEDEAKSGGARTFETVLCLPLDLLWSQGDVGRS